MKGFNTESTLTPLQVWLLQPLTNPWLLLLPFPAPQISPKPNTRPSTTPQISPNPHPYPMEEDRLIGWLFNTVAETLATFTVKIGKPLWLNSSLVSANTPSHGLYRLPSNDPLTIFPPKALLHWMDCSETGMSDSPKSRAVCTIRFSAPPPHLPTPSPTLCHLTQPQFLLIHPGYRREPTYALPSVGFDISKRETNY